MDKRSNHHIIFVILIIIAVVVVTRPPPPPSPLPLLRSSIGPVLRAVQRAVPLLSRYFGPMRLSGVLDVRGQEGLLRFRVGAGSAPPAPEQVPVPEQV